MWEMCLRFAQSLMGGMWAIRGSVVEFSWQFPVGKRQAVHGSTVNFVPLMSAFKIYALSTLANCKLPIANFIPPEIKPDLYLPITTIKMSKKKHNPGGLVWSTDSDYMSQMNEESEASETLAKDKQKLRVKLDTKQRAGKVVTLVEGFIGTGEDLEALGKQLKTKCGTGGSAKDGLIIIQGDYRDKILGWLKDWGYSGTK